jgi:hypothetical protein
MSPDDEAEAADLANRVGRLADGKPCDVALLALSMVASAVMHNASEGDRILDATGFAALMINVHLGLEDEEPQDIISTVGALPRDVAHAATELCAPLGLLMTGLMQHYVGGNVINAWLSVLLQALLAGGGIEQAQALIRRAADSLPAVAAQMDALRALDAGGNTGQMGRA